MNTDKHPTPLSSLFAPRALLIGVVLLTIYRLLVITQPYLSLFYDEAYYYHWSLNPDWGFYSKPPMVGWVIWLTTHLFGTSDLTIKIGALLLHSATTYWVYQIARHFAGSAAGAAAGWVYISAIIVGFNSVFITTDAPLLFFWAASCWCFLKAIETNAWRWWLWLGVATGLGMLSKYTMALLPLGLFGLMLWQRDLRPRLATAKPWAAAVLAGIVFSPNIIWNALNGFVTLGHTGEIARLDGPLLNFDHLAEFLAGQLLVIGPFWSWLLIRKLWARNERDPDAARYLPFVLATFLPLMGVIATQALLSRAFVNWAAPCLIAACVWCGIQVVRFRPRYLALGVVAQLFLLSLLHHWPTLLDALKIERSTSNDPYQRVLGWPELGAAMGEWMVRYPEARPTSSARDLLAYVGYYADPGRVFLAKWEADPDRVDDYYDQLYNVQRFDEPSAAFLLMEKRPATAEQLASFTSCEPLTRIRVPVYADLEREVYLYYCEGFVGYSGGS